MQGEVVVPRPFLTLKRLTVPDELLTFPATRLIELYKSHAVSPVDVTRAVLKRINQLDPIFNAFCVVDEDAALASAQASEQRWHQQAPAGLVDGLPTTVKDLVLAKGWPTRRGSLTINPDQIWDEDGPPVARMREQGAVIIGKTTTPEFGWKGVTDSPLTGITRNPWNPKLTPGGSSGGAATAAALGMGPLHIATDGGGSIRIPAAFCGVFGFKSTWGLVPVHPHSPALSLWHQGPITRTVGDAALMQTVIARADMRDWYQTPMPEMNLLRNLEAGIKGWRIGFSMDLGYAKVDPRVARQIEKQLKIFTDLGAIVEPLDLKLDDPIAIMRPLWAVALALAVRPMTAAQRKLVEPAMLELAEPGFGMSALEYRQLEREREALGRRMNNLHAEYDLIITPQMPITAFAADHEVPPESGLERWWEWSPFTYPFNLTQQPTATVPCGFVDGLPVAMQLIGAKFSDAKVLQAARAFESVQPFAMPSSQINAALAAATS